MAVSTRPLRRARGRPCRSPYAPAAGSSPRPSHVARTKGMTVLPPIFDTIPELGATKLRATFPYPFLILTGRFETLAAVVTFSRFWAGKFHRHATNRYRYGPPLPRRIPTKQNKKYKSEGSKYEERARDDISCGRRNFGRETTFHPVRDVIGVGLARRSRSDEHDQLPVKPFR